jgi:hypothetical protein
VDTIGKDIFSDVLRRRMRLAVNGVRSPKALSQFKAVVVNVNSSECSTRLKAEASL